MILTATLLLLVRAGVRVQIVEDIPNPFKDSVKPRFLNALNKLHLWRMTRYTRVIYLDSDNIVTNNMDELFGVCGVLCAHVPVLTSDAIVCSCHSAKP